MTTTLISLCTFQAHVLGQYTNSKKKESRFNWEVYTIHEWSVSPVLPLYWKFITSSKVWLILWDHVSWEPEGRYHYSTKNCIANQKGKGSCCSTKSLAIAPFWYLNTTLLNSINTLLVLTRQCTEIGLPSFQTVFWCCRNIFHKEKNKQLYFSFHILVLHVCTCM